MGAEGAQESAQAVRLLLDTHALFWFLTENKKLSARALRAIESPKNELWASAVSGYEIGRKYAYGKIDLPAGELTDKLRGAGIEELPVEIEHAIMAAELPQHHNDPWDRILVAQAKLDDLILVTTDEKLQAYGTPTFW
jgi:PIN domain nuclease of toxin-antitoxin system